MANQVTISAGESTSGLLTFGETFGDEPQRYLRLKLVSGTWDSASVGVKVSEDGINFYPARLAGSYTAVANISATVYDFVQFPIQKYIKLWSHNGSGTPVNQSQDIVLEVVYV